MPRLVWTPEALDDLQTIFAYIADRNLVAAENILIYRAHADVIEVLAVVLGRRRYP